MRNHHNFEQDKDTPESIRQLLEQDTDVPPKSQHGLPAGDRLDNYAEPDDPNLRVDDDRSDEIPLYDKGVDKPLPGEFHGKGPGA